MVKWVTSWPRLWLVLAGLYLGVLVVFTALSLPRQRDLAHTRVFDSINAVPVYRYAHEPGFAFPYADHVREHDYRDLSDEAIIQRLHTEWGGKVDFSEIEVEYKHNLAALHWAQQEIPLFVFIYLWGLPVLPVYVPGAIVWTGIAWGIRRLRRPAP